MGSLLKAVWLEDFGAGVVIGVGYMKPDGKDAGVDPVDLEISWDVGRQGHFDFNGVVRGAQASYMSCVGLRSEIYKLLGIDTSA